MARIFISLWAALALMTGSAVAQDRGVYDIYLGAVPVGIFAFSGVEARGQYSLAGQLRTTGLVGALTQVRYEAKAQGRISGGRFRPIAYDEVARIGERETTLSITYRGGVPDAPVFDPPRISDRPTVNPAEQGDTLDVLTGFYALLRDLPEDEVCRFRSLFYDGARRTSIALRPLRRSETEAVCAAEYRRLGGFTEAELRVRETFDFQLFYEVTAEGDWRVQQADVETVYGVVRLERRAP